MKDRPSSTLIVAACASLGFLAWMAVRTPRAVGDSGDYLLTLEAFANHASPDVRASDAASLGTTAAQSRIRGSFGDVWHQTRASRQGRVYTWHFWAYPLAVVPVKLAVRLLGGNELAAPQVANALFLMAAAWVVWLAPWLDRRVAGWWSILSVIGPPAWFCVWPHPEVLTFALVTIAVACAMGFRLIPATAALAVASTQNPPLLSLAATLAIAAATRPPRTGNRLGLVLAAIFPAFVPTIFYLSTFGRPSLMLGESVSFETMSPSKAAGLLLDLNMGLLPYVPGAVVLAALALVLTRGGERREVMGCWAAFVAGALGASAGVVWNFGTSGPSRYAVWLSPFLIAAAAQVARKRWGTAALAAALAAQTVVLVTRLPKWAEDDHTEHSYAASFVLRHWPALYSPHEDIFTDRTPALYPDGPHVFRDGGTCRKALAQKRHADALTAACGPLPEQFLTWSREIARAGIGRDAWQYVDYGR